MPIVQSILTVFFVCLTLSAPPTLGKDCLVCFEDDGDVGCAEGGGHRSVNCLEEYGSAGPDEEPWTHCIKVVVSTRKSEFGAFIA